MIKSFVGGLNSNDTVSSKSGSLFTLKQCTLVIIEAHLEMNYTGKNARNIWHIPE
jgi:hypothetical protein